MPRYCYRSKDRNSRLIERVFSSIEIPESFKEGRTTYVRSRKDEWAKIYVPPTSGWPMECVASGVAPEQAQELRDHFRKCGVPTEVTADGNPVYRNAAHRKKALKCRGFHDRASYL